MNILFFGSTNDSLLVAEALVAHKYNIKAIITQPPRPVGRKSDPMPTPVETWGKSHKIPVLTFQTNPEKPWLFQDDEAVTNTLSTEKPDLLITACFGQKIPTELINISTHGGLNVHPSLLPRWRGADPIPWTILSGDAQTGVTVVTISEKFDQGKIINQKKIPVNSKLSADDLRSELFRLGTDLLVNVLPDYLDGSNKGKDQDQTTGTIARKLTRAHGFIPWENVRASMDGEVFPSNEIGTKDSEGVIRMIRAFTPWPGVWTTVNLTNPTNMTNEKLEKRLKILEAHTDREKLVLDIVQLEGKNPIQWKTFEKSYEIT